MNTELSKVLLNYGLALPSSNRGLAPGFVATSKRPSMPAGSACAILSWPWSSSWAPRCASASSCTTTRTTTTPKPPTRSRGPAAHARRPRGRRHTRCASGPCPTVTFSPEAHRPMNQPILDPRNPDGGTPSRRLRSPKLAEFSRWPGSKPDQGRYPRQPRDAGTRTAFPSVIAKASPFIRAVRSSRLHRRIRTGSPRSWPRSPRAPATCWAVDRKSRAAVKPPHGDNPRPATQRGRVPSAVTTTIG
jgi:hypothetical protein